jgi:hypothetical protein
MSKNTPKNMSKKLTPILLSAAIFYAGTAFAATNFSLQNNLIGATSAVKAQGKNGAGITFGVIDSGVAAPWVGFSPSSIDTAKSACMISGCSKTLAIRDDNGHGTFVSSQLVGNVPSVGMSGIATSGKVLAVKVLNAQGSGNSNDLNKGIRYAVDNGAQILNLSLGPSGTPSQQAAFYQSIASAVNYAASKNAVIVFAGGNSAQAFSGGANISGFTDAALARTIFVGSTNANLGLSSFSNTAGTGAFISTTNKKVNYNSMWLMADGEAVWGASNYNTPSFGYSYITQMSGTSMAAPQVAGAAGLLAARWNFLLGTGKITEILEKTAQDLGAKGVDNTYGYGFLRIDNAMQPIGTLTVPVNGKNVSVANSQIVSSSSLGNMSKVSTALKTSTAYDDYKRDFTVNTPTVTTSSTTSSTSTTAAKQVSSTNVSSTRKFVSFDEGVSFSYAGDTNFSGSQTVEDTGSQLQTLFSEGADPLRESKKNWLVSYEQKGLYLSYGEGSSGSMLFSDARWGGDSVFFNTDSSTRTSLLGVVDNANFSAVGIDVGTDSKVAFGFLYANNSNDDLGLTNMNETSATGTAIAYTTKATENSKISFTSSILNEENSLLGSVSGGVVGFGKSTSSVAFGVGGEYDFENDLSLGLDLNYSTTNATKNPDSLITSTSRLQSYSANLALTKKNLATTDDKLGFSIIKPMRVFSGSANLSLPTGADDEGNPIIQNQTVSLAASGSETNFTLSYFYPFTEDLDTNVNFSYRNDADNIAGNTDGAAMLKIRYSFN